MVQDRPDDRGNDDGEESGGGGGGWSQKVKHSPLVMRHDSLLFTVLLGAVEGSRRLDLNAQGRTGLPMYMYIK